MKNRLSYLLLTLLGFGCTSSNNEQLCMYGTPRIDTRIQGQVTDKSGAPVPGIAVLQHDTGNAVSTANDGRYDISGSAFPGHAYLVFKDIDGPANGGEFEETTLEVTFSQADKVGKGDGEWYSGSFARKDVDVILEEKTGQE